MLFNKIKKLLKASARILLLATICYMLVITNVLPANAATSRISQGEDNLNQIQRRTDNISGSNPRGLKEVSETAKGGLNAVQGSADKEKMLNNDNAEGTTVEKQVKDFLEDTTK